VDETLGKIGSSNFNEMLGEKAGSAVLDYRNAACLERKETQKLKLAILAYAKFALFRSNRLMNNEKI
jgi:hypothetical protein